MARAACLLLLLGVWLLGGCSSIAYYSQSVGGHLRLMSKRQDVRRLAADAATPDVLKRHLAAVLDMRAFASRELALPDNGSYRGYVDVDAPYVVWNVVATPEFSLKALTWCFPVVGCVAYRGYYARADAQAFAAGLRAEGLDVLVAGASAYSTLGWFDDPVLSTMLDQPLYALAGTLFHELAHQQVYVKDDTAFNEAFAVAVETEGVRRWLAARGRADLRLAYERSRRREVALVAMLTAARERLQGVYASDWPAVRKRREKARVFAALRAEYALRKEELGEGYARLFSDELNNAGLALVAAYHERVPAFLRLLDEHDGDFPAFYAAVEALGRLPAAARAARLDALMARAGMTSRL